MKKKYISPALLMMNVAIKETLLVGSLEKFEDKVSGVNGGWTKDSGDWDIWGNGSGSDDDYDDYDY